MLKLSGRAIRTNISRTALLMLDMNRETPAVLRQDRAWLAIDTQQPPDGYAHYVGISTSLFGAHAVSSTILPEDFGYLRGGDILRIATNGHVRTLFRRSSNHNFLLLTEQCNNFCLMCSQPPKTGDDSWLADEMQQLIPMLPRSTKQIGITGGEPTLFGAKFIHILALMRSWLPETSVHVLSNGRLFADEEFTEAYVAVRHPDLMVGIPLYSDEPSVHDYVVQAAGAFDETVRGILSLKRMGAKVEIRVVVHKQTYERLISFAEFVARNLVFVDHVALMGLEITGFTRANIESLWIDPIEYKTELSTAVKILRAYGIRTSIYNHQLCLIDRDIEEAYVRSISDWKNEYAPECEGCRRRQECGGFFSSGIAHKYSPSVRPF